MRLPVLITAIALAIPGPAAQADGRPAAVSFHDPHSDLTFTARDDGRTLVITNRNGGFLGVFDPLFDGDGGREGTIVAIRAATGAEMSNFKPQETGPYVVLTYSGGGVLVVSTGRTAALRPRRCGNTRVAARVAVVAANIACRIDLDQASTRFEEAMTASFLSDGPSSITPIDFPVPCSDIVLHVDSDGRTVRATGKKGKILWVGDPFERGGLKPYRHRRPLIWKVSAPETPDGKGCRTGRLSVALQYTSTQFGLLNARTGAFEFGGQD